MAALDEMIEEAAPGNARRRAFDQMVQREKALAEALPEDRIEVVQDGIAFAAVEEAGDVRLTVTDMGDGESVEPEEQIRVELPPLGADALGTGLIELARKARGLPSGYLTRPRGEIDVRGVIAAGTPIDRLNLTAYAENPKALQAAADFLEAIKNTGLKVSSEYGSVVISRPMTDEERAEAVKVAQRRWDDDRELYEYNAALGSKPQDHGEVRRIVKFCEAESLPLPWRDPA